METFPLNHDFINRWPQGWTARSTAYRQGFQCGFRGEHRKPTLRQCPYTAGSAEFDAWYAGIDAGVLKVRVQKESARETMR